jgi:hypothetical protein
MRHAVTFEGRLLTESFSRHTAMGKGIIQAENFQERIIRDLIQAWVEADRSRGKKIMISFVICQTELGNVSKHVLNRFDPKAIIASLLLRTILKVEQFPDLIHRILRIFTKVGRREHFGEASQIAQR